MRAAEAILVEEFVGVADEVPVGKEQKFDRLGQPIASGGKAVSRGLSGMFGGYYHFMSAMLTYFPLSATCYKLHETEWASRTGRSNLPINIKDVRPRRLSPANLP
jgi:hypothetical protein